MGLCRQALATDSPSKLESVANPRYAAMVDRAACLSSWGAVMTTGGQNSIATNLPQQEDLLAAFLACD